MLGFAIETIPCNVPLGSWRMPEPGGGALPTPQALTSSTVMLTPRVVGELPAAVNHLPRSGAVPDHWVRPRIVATEGELSTKSLSGRVFREQMAKPWAIPIDVGGVRQGFRSDRSRSPGRRR